jgi:hypothetical protein
MNTKRTNEIKSSFFEMIIKIGKHLAKLNERKEKT